MPRRKARTPSSSTKTSTRGLQQVDRNHQQQREDSTGNVKMGATSAAAAAAPGSSGPQVGSVRSSAAAAAAAAAATVLSSSPPPSHSRGRVKAAAATTNRSSTTTRKEQESPSVRSSASSSSRSRTSLVERNNRGRISNSSRSGAGETNALMFSPPPYHHKSSRYPPPSSAHRRPHHSRGEYPPTHMEGPAVDPMLEPYPRNAREYDHFDLNESMMGDAVDHLFPLDPNNDDSGAGSPFPATADVDHMDEDASRKRSYRRSPGGPPPYPMDSEAPDSAPRSASRSRQSRSYAPPHRGGPYPPPYPQHAGGPPPYYYAPHYPPNHGSRTPSRPSPNSRPSAYSHGQGYYPGYSPYHRHQGERYPWPPPPPPPLHAGPIMEPPYDSDEEEGVPPPPSSSKKRPLSPHRESHSTPRSPYRSPPPGGSTKRHFRPSPIFQGSPPPQLGTMGSFEFETPSGVLGNNVFSPMGPSFDDGGNDLSFGGDGLSGSRWNLSRSHSQDDSESSPIAPVRSRRHMESSPWTMDMSPMGPVMLQSPMPPSLPFDTNYQARPSSARKSKPGEVTVSDRRGEPPSSRLDGTAQPLQLFPPSAVESSSKVSPSGTPGPVRLEIGGGSASRNKLDGINNMMHSSRPEPHGRDFMSPGRRHIPPPQAALAQHHHPSMHPPYQGMEMETPMKPSYPRHPPPQGGYRMQFPPPPQHGSGQKPMYPSPVMKNEYHDATGANKPVFIARSEMPPAASANASSAGGGNQGPAYRPPTKRSPCNCKKSRCLKLYCDCFANERFCNGCNCIDCHNTPEAGAIREKAIKDTRAKNSKAFQSRIAVKDAQGSGAPQKVHTMGCKCKKSGCLKKYCECFQAGVMCGDKCKCTDCLNFPGSQALIDKRLKMKDQKGANIAMKASEEKWRGQSVGSARNPLPTGQPQGQGSHGQPNQNRRPLSSSINRMPHQNHMLHPGPHSGPYGGQHGGPHGGPPSHGNHPYPHGPPHPHYMGPPPPHIMRGHHGPPMGFSPMGVPMTPGGYPGPPPPHHRMPHEGMPRAMYPPPPSQSNSRPSTTRNAPPKEPPKPTPPPKPDAKDDEESPRESPVKNIKETPSVVSPKIPAPVRLQFDPFTSRKIRGGKDEPLENLFGDQVPPQPKTVALTIFSFLPNEDLYHAGLVSKKWSHLAMDKELWKFHEEVRNETEDA